MDGWLRVGVGVAIVAHRTRRSLDDMSCASDLPYGLEGLVLERGEAEGGRAMAGSEWWDERSRGVPSVV